LVLLTLMLVMMLVMLPLPAQRRLMRGQDRDPRLKAGGGWSNA